jgi:PilZ domain
MQSARSEGSSSREVATIKDASERAIRVSLDLPVRFRAAGTSRWHEGRIENISRSGVLLRASDVLAVDTEVVLELVLPVPPQPVSITCFGHVVRTVTPGGLDRRPGLATTISRYRFHRARHAA